MTARPRARKGDELDQVYMAAFLGDDCPEGFNPFKFLAYQELVESGRCWPAEDAAPVLEAWPRMRDDVLREWKRRKRKGSPPGCTLDTRK